MAIYTGASSTLTSSLGIAAWRRRPRTEHVNRTLKMEPGGTLRLKNFSGRVTITASDRPEVVIDAVRRASRERLARIRLDIRTDGPNVVVVDANRRDRFVVRVHQREPRRRDRLRHQSAAQDQPRYLGVQLAGDRRRHRRVAQGAQLLGAAEPE